MSVFVLVLGLIFPFCGVYDNSLVGGPHKLAIGVPEACLWEITTGGLYEGPGSDRGRNRKREPTKEVQ